MVSNQIIEVLNEICNKFGLAIDWTSKNVQPYLQELIAKCVAYKFATSILWLIFGILVCTIGGVFAKMDHYPIAICTVQFKVLQVSSFSLLELSWLYVTLPQWSLVRRSRKKWCWI